LDFDILRDDVILDVAQSSRLKTTGTNISIVKLSVLRGYSELRAGYFSSLKFKTGRHFLIAENSKGLRAVRDNV
jgi:hypothetical protein